MKFFANTYLKELKELFERLDLDPFEKIVKMILKAYDERKNIFVMGNGGSGSTASHFACDINKGCCFDLEKKFKMICLNDSLPTLLALSNDASFDLVFVEQMKNFFNKGDLVIGISGSGNSQNVLNAIDYAKKNGGITMGLSGFSGGKLSQMVDIPFVAAIDDMQKVEDIHMIVVHMIMQAVHITLHEKP
ncbi:MAG: SIS domain-containing protein [Candidatus Altiarchaeota archaeon]|nr:SIS domain-containing protein [Candidatus Altiarchaeota archaeon]